LPVSGKYVMDAEEAAEVAVMIKPNLVIPMHYGAGVAGTHEDAEKFVKLCKEKGLNARILEKI
jgi:L-ascorbate metabolism protein UlaG (beta-lactamase superfamily)